DANAILSSLGHRAFIGSWAGTPREGYFVMAFVFSLIMVACTWTTFFGTRERDLNAAANSPSLSTPFDYASSIVRELQGNKPFQVSVLILLLTNCAATFVAVNLPYFLQYVVDLKAYQTQILLTLFLSAILSVVVWVWIAKRFGKTESYRVAMIFYVVVLMCLPLLPVGSVGAAVAASIFAGFFHAAGLMIPWAIVPDVVEFDELKVGRRREGLFYGGTTFSYKFATAIAIFVSGSILESVGYQPNAVQTPEAMLGIKFLIGPVPAVLLLLGAYLSTKYPLSKEKHQQIVDALAAKRRAAVQQTPTPTHSINE
ncbi:MAG: MFS transporter, partial [Bdellovibrionales bacterium]|nr:MFS transporter [Bdellovibrionales bacterium]